MVVHSEVLTAYVHRPTSTVQDPAVPRTYLPSGLPPDNSAQNRILQHSVVNRMLPGDRAGSTAQFLGNGLQDRCTRRESIRLLNSTRTVDSAPFNPEIGL